MKAMRSHLEMSELLALRDGQGTVSARSHLDSCRICRGELERLYRIRAELRALEVLHPSRELLPGLLARVTRSQNRRRLVFGIVGLAAAAALAGVIALQGPATRELPQAIGDPWSVETASPDLRAMVARSRRLESLLHSHGTVYQVFDAPTALAVSVLEDRITLIDQALLDSRVLDVDRALIRGLWEERVNALETLVDIHAVRQEKRWR